MIFLFVNHVGLNHFLLTIFLRLWGFREFKWPQPHDSWRSSALASILAWVHVHVCYEVCASVTNGLNVWLKMYANGISQSRISYSCILKCEYVKFADGMPSKTLHTPIQIIISSMLICYAKSHNQVPVSLIPWWKGSRNEFACPLQEIVFFIFGTCLSHVSDSNFLHQTPDTSPPSSSS